MTQSIFRFVLTDEAQNFIESLPAYFGDTHPGISVISTQFVSYKMALGCKFIISFLNSHLLSQNDAKSVQFCPGSHQQ